MWLFRRGLFRPFGPLGLALLAYRIWRRLSPARRAELSEPGAASVAPPPGRGKPLDGLAFVAWAQALDFALGRAAERFDGLPQRVFGLFRELRERLQPDATGDLHLDEGLEGLVVVSSIHREDRDARRFAPETTCCVCNPFL